MPTKRIVAFVIAIMLTVITLFTAFMQTACIVGTNDIDLENISSDPDMHPGGVLILGFTDVMLGFFAFVMMGATVNFSIVSMILAFSNTNPRRCEIKSVRVTSWTIFGINCALILYSIVAIFFI